MPSIDAEGVCALSAVFPSIGSSGVLLLHIGEQRLDARGAGDSVVFLELDRRSNAQLKLLGNS